MKHILLFCYIVSVLIGACVLTLQWTCGREASAGKISRRGLFALVILVVNTYMMLVYYNDNIWKEFNREVLLGVGDFMMIILLFTWLAAEEKMSGEEKRAVCIINGSLLLYACLCLASGSVSGWEGLAGALLPVPMIVILLLEGCRAVRAERRTTDSRELIWYEMTQTLLMSLIFLLYMRNEGRTELLILCWILVNAVNLVYTYKRESPGTGSFSNLATAVKSTDDIITDMQTNYRLTNRERELVQEIYKGRSNGEIADELFISESTVKAHIYNIFRKTGAKNRMEIVCMIREQAEKQEQV